MAICIEFELVRVTDKGAIYRYGHCLHNKDFELEFLFHGIYFDSVEDILFTDIMIQKGEKSDFMAIRVFSKVYKHYRSTGEFLGMGDYHA